MIEATSNVLDSDGMLLELRSTNGRTLSDNLSEHELVYLIAKLQIIHDKWFGVPR